MSSANAYAVFIHSRNCAEKLRTLKGRYSACLSSYKLRIIFKQSRGINYHLGAFYIFRPLTHGNGDTELTYSVKRIALVIVRTGELIAPAVKYLGKRAHTAAAYPNKVYSLYFF